MTLHIQGLIAIPEDPQVNIIKPASGAGFFINFRATSQGKVGNKTEYQYWNCSMWIPEEERNKWELALVSGNVFYIEHAEALSLPNTNNKYYNTKLKLEFNKVKKLQSALWLEEKVDKDVK